MQKVIILTTIALLTLANATCAQPNLLWSRIFGGEEAEDCRAVIQTRDGGFALAGWTESFGEGGSDFWLIVTDDEGQMLWSQTYGGEGDDRCHAILQTEDGDFVLAGYTESFGEGGRDYWAIRVNDQGDVIWSQTFGGAEDEECNAIIETAEGGFALAGNTASFEERGEGGEGNNYWLVETDADGEQLRAQAYHFGVDDRCNSILQRPQGGFEMGGTINMLNNRLDYKFSMMTSNEDGSLYSWLFMGSDAGCNSIVRHADDGIILAGWKGTDGQDNGKFMLIKLDDEFGIDWWGNYGSDVGASCQSVIQTEDGGVAMAGYSDAFRDDATDVWLVRTNERGVQLYSQNYGGEQNDGCNSIIETPDGGLVMAGYTESFAEGETDFWLLKVDPGLFWMALPDTGFVEDSTLVFELSYFFDYVSPVVAMDTLITYEAINGEHVQGEIDGGELIISAEDGWFGLDSLMLIVTEVRNPDNADSTYLRLTVSEFDDVEEPQFFEVPGEFTLHDAYPNPFNSTTTIKYTVPLIMPVMLEIYDVNGRLVETLVDGLLPAGRHSVVWDAGGVGAGVYFVRMKDEGGGMKEEIQKVTLVK